jgi:hypothetical protein
MVIEAGASVKEAQTLLRHSTPQLTMNAYARARDHRLAEVTDRVGAVVLAKSGQLSDVPGASGREGTFPINDASPCSCKGLHERKLVEAGMLVSNSRSVFGSHPPAGTRTPGDSTRGRTSAQKSAECREG